MAPATTQVSASRYSRPDIYEASFGWGWEITAGVIVFILGVVEHLWLAALATLAIYVLVCSWYILSRAGYWTRFRARLSANEWGVLWAVALCVSAFICLVVLIGLFFDVAERFAKEQSETRPKITY